jgi:putative membrane protein insertion efficiency factor
MLKRVAFMFMAAIRFYQRFLSPLKPMPTCRFLPTCSSYALEAIQLRGVARGTLMALWRILRCNPFFPGGFDPVEPRLPKSPKSGDWLGASNEEHGCASCAQPEPAGHSSRGVPMGASRAGLG